MSAPVKKDEVAPSDWVWFVKVGGGEISGSTHSPTLSQLMTDRPKKQSGSVPKIIILSEGANTRWNTRGIADAEAREVGERRWSYTLRSRSLRIE